MKALQQHSQTFHVCPLEKSAPEDDAINIYIQPCSKRNIASKQYSTLVWHSESHAISIIAFQYINKINNIKDAKMLFICRLFLLHHIESSDASNKQYIQSE